MALSKTEARVMDRWDAGQTLRQIASETRLTLARVTEIVQIYHCRDTARDHRAQMAQASALLRTAILAQPSSPTGQPGAPL